MKGLDVRFARLRTGAIRALACVAVILLVCSGAWAQKNKKNQSASDQPMPSMPMSCSISSLADIGIDGIG